jgi:hypothetical protein
MEERRRIRVIRDWDDCRVSLARGQALVEVPGAWAHAVLSLVKISEEHRHNGLIVTHIGPGSQGAMAGMVRGDVLLHYDGEEIDSAHTLRRLAKRHTQGAELTKTVTIDAARGGKDISFQVRGGLLGITASPPLHRLKRVRVVPTGAQATDRNSVGRWSTIAVIYTLEGARKHDPSKPALVEVPAEWARKVLGLVKSLEASSASGLKKIARGLLSTARP